MTNSKNTFITFFVLIFIYLISLLVGPRIAYETDGSRPVNVYLKGPFGVSLDCDGPEFMDNANHPQHLLNDNAVRQSRPGIIFLANIVSKFVRPAINVLLNYIHPSSPHTVWHPLHEIGLKEYPASYAAYVIINFCLLILTALIWINLLGKNPSPLALSLVSLVFFNSVVKIFFYLPHTQIFNVLMPTATYWITAKSFEDDFLYKKITYWLMAALGFGLLCYGTFIIPVIIFGTISLLRHWHLQKSIPWRALWRLVQYGFIFSAPFVLWCLYVISVKGTIYFHESESCNQFVWMKKTFMTHGLLSMCTKYVNNITSIILSGKEFLPVTLLLCICAYFLVKKEAFTQHFKIASIASISSLLFLAAMGFFPWRLAFIICMPIWIAASLALNTIAAPRKEYIWLTYLFLIGYGIYLVLSPARF